MPLRFPEYKYIETKAIHLFKVQLKFVWYFWFKNMLIFTISKKLYIFPKSSNFSNSSETLFPPISSQISFCV